MCNILFIIVFNWLHAKMKYFEYHWLNVLISILILVSLVSFILSSMATRIFECTYEFHLPVLLDDINFKDIVFNLITIKNLFKVL